MAGMSAQLVAYRVTETVADPIPVSRFGVPVEQVTKRGYVAGGVCLHCRDGVVVVQAGTPWVHKETRIRSCRFELARTSSAEPNESHRLAQHPRTKLLYCPTCSPTDPPTDRTATT